MELMDAIKKLNNLNTDVKKMDRWFNELKISTIKPVQGKNWIKLQKSIDAVISEVQQEANELEEKIKKETDKYNIEIK